MNNWARENESIKHGDAEMAKAFNRHFGQERRPGAMKNIFQALHESGNLMGPRKTLAFYQYPKNKDRKPADKTRPGYGKSKGRNLKKESTAKANDAEQESDDSGEIEAAQTEAAGPSNNRKHDRGIVGGSELLDAAIEPAMDSSGKPRP
jgi:hypothetical protein